MTHIPIVGNKSPHKQLYVAQGCHMVSLVESLSTVCVKRPVLVIGSIGSTGCSHIQCRIQLLILGSKTLLTPHFRVPIIYGGFHKWGYPNMVGLFHGKSHLEMDDL